MKHYIFIFILAITVIGCKETNKSKIDKEHTSKNSLTWTGSYFNTLPCADCPGIDTRITLNKDNTYLWTSEYQDEDEQPEPRTGSFSFDNSGNIITLLAGDEQFKFKVEENALIMLDAEGNEVTDKLAEFYRLAKE